MIAQQEQVKQDLETQISEYQRLVKDSQQFRGQYAYKLAEIINALEKTMRYNVEQISNSISEYSNNGVRNQSEMTKIMEQLSKVIPKPLTKTCRISRT